MLATTNRETCILTETKKPKIHIVKEGFFDFWLKTKKKLGGQNKIPRLSNDRVYLDSMLDHINLFQ